MLALGSSLISFFINEIWQPIKKQAGYCFHLDANVTALSESLKDLQCAICGITEKIQIAESERRKCTQEVKDWLDKSQIVEEQAKAIIDKYEKRRTSLCGCSWDCFFNISINKTAIKKKTGVSELVNKAPSDVANSHLLVNPIKEMPNTHGVVGQEMYLRNVIDCLQDDKVGIIGIYGMGGVGKTTLLRSINNHFSDNAEFLEFNHVIFVKVGKNLDLMKLQDDIACEVGLLLRKEESMLSRATAIFNFLKCKKFLLLLDDLWGSLDLVEVGVPRPNRGTHVRPKQKIILTTRLSDICGKMQADKYVRIECLNEEDAWNLFKSKVAEATMSNTRIQDLARRLARECSGLPLALTTVGLTMSMKKTPLEWENAIGLLKKSSFPEILSKEDDLFPVLHISYDYLKDDRMKNCFLFCSLIPENMMVSSEYLVETWVGLGLMEDIDNIEDAYTTGYSIIESLKVSCLLESNTKIERFIGMHDVIRDLAVWIASDYGRNKKRWLVQAFIRQAKSDEWAMAERISIPRNHLLEALPESCHCPNLLSLMLPRNNCLSKIPDKLFLGMPALTYLDLGSTSIQDLPAEIGTLVNLQYLNLSYTNISSLPEELKLLVNLKYLVLEGAILLKKIPQGVVSNLRQLLVLNLYDTNLVIGDPDGLIFEELKLLAKLKAIGVTIKDIPLLQMIFALPKITKYLLSIQHLYGLTSLHLSPTVLHDTKANDIKYLTVLRCEGLKELVIGLDEEDDQVWCLPHVERLRLLSLPKLEKIIWKRVEPHECLPNLLFLHIYKCGSLDNIDWILHLPSLQELYLYDCKGLKQMISEEATPSSLPLSSSANQQTTSPFSNLKFVLLDSLEEMTSICNDSLSFPSLARIAVFNCRKLKRLPMGLYTEGKDRDIHGEGQWWNSLEWTDESIKSLFSPHFVEYPDGHRPRPTRLHELL